MSQKVVIDADKASFSLNLGELHAYRDLFWVMASRDIKVRYAQTYLGAVWIFLQPLLQLIIFGFVFGKVARMAPNGIPYAVFAIPGLTAWTYFSSVALQAGGSLIGMQNTIRKIYFPRLILPLTKSVTLMTDFVVYLLFIGITLLFYGVAPSGYIIFLPFFILLNIIFALGIGIWTSALTIRFRDFHTITQFVIQLGVFATPVYYSADQIPARFNAILALNPAALIVAGFRWCILGDRFAIPTTAWYSLPILFLVFITGVIYFKKVEKIIADLI